MKVVILAGGFGTRISEESHLKPKPMIEIGEKPILWHIMKEYSHYGYNDFIICLGYKQHVIKEYFADYYLHTSDITLDMKTNEMTVHNNCAEPWKITLIDTGLNTMTGGRVKRIQKYVGNETFMLTYGDGVCDINIKDLVKFHKQHKKIATITAIQPGGKFGALDIDEEYNTIKSFMEKRKEDGGWINGGYMVLEPEIFDYLGDDTTVFEKEPLEKVSNKGELVAYKYDGFWQCMDTLRDKLYLEELVEKNKAPWKVWSDKC
ncbi:MAG: glucose-1-phosphate cytidylyltransferase [Bacilli bacterium]|nr:glucose-1-phosphate cytidylyltransferase [Bacilli bacterium]